MKKPAFIAVLNFLVLSVALLFSPADAQTVSSFTKDTDGALCVLSNGSRLKLQVCAGNIIRVVMTPQSTIPSPQGLIVARSTFAPGAWDAVDNGTTVVVTTPIVKATVTKSNSAVSFTTASGTAICSEIAGGRTMAAVTKGGQAGYSGTLGFNSPSNESVYGLGALSLSAPAWTGDTSYWAVLPPDNTGVLDIRNFTFDLHQVNWYDIIPFFMTTSGYGVLMNLTCHGKKTWRLYFTADFLTNNSWDYYFVYGPQFDTIISGYRYLTGPAPMPAKWAFGFWQCKNRYASSAEITTAVASYRSNNIPIDCIVQDWNWWSNGYGSFTWDAANYPNPTSLLSTIHTNNCHFAISIWETFSSTAPTFSAMQPYLLPVSLGCNTNPGQFLNIFDTTGARKFWDLMNNSLLSIGVDGWWMDATEPECPLLTGVATSSGVIDQYANAFSLASAKNIYEKQRAVSTAKRVVNLTRSFNAGQQRFGTIYWNGDISGATINNVRTTVAGGLNSCMAGNPYWCSDIGGFQNTPTDETLIRWFEAGTFFPIFRVHGSRATEIYTYNAQPRQICTDFSILRYRLMPYIYSLAWKVTNENYTMTRALPFDFPNDSVVRNNATQFMFGTALMINPVTVAGATSRSVYLPAGNWYDFWTGAVNSGAAGRNVQVAAPLQTIPIYARAGAILPMGPKIQYATQSADPIELRVYPGADGSFTLYEDQGDGYGYETGAYSTIPISYSNATGKVTIGARNGTFPGMLTSRTFNVIFVSIGHGMADTVTANPDCVISYNGTGVTGCPVTGTCRECAARAAARQLPFSLKTADERVVLPAEYSGAKTEVIVYGLTGRVLRTATFVKNSFSLRKDFGLLNGTYFIKARVVL